MSWQKANPDSFTEGMNAIDVHKNVSIWTFVLLEIQQFYNSKTSVSKVTPGKRQTVLPIWVSFCMIENFLTTYPVKVPCTALWKVIRWTITVKETNRGQVITQSSMSTFEKIDALPLNDSQYMSRLADVLTLVSLHKIQFSAYCHELSTNVIKFSPFCTLDLHNAGPPFHHLAQTVKQNKHAAFPIQVQQINSHSLLRSKMADCNHISFASGTSHIFLLASLIAATQCM